MSIQIRLMMVLIGTTLGSLAATTTCLPTTLDLYLAPGLTCQTGDRVYSNFMFSTTNPSLLQPSKITVQPLSNGGFFFPTPGGLPGSPLTISSAPDGSAMALGFTIGYEVMAVNNQQFNTESVDFNGGGFHNGLASLTDAFCIGHAIAGCPAGQGGQSTLAIGSNPPGTFANTFVFPNGTKDLFLSFNATLNSGVQGSANFVQFENELPVSPAAGTGGTGGGVPEPATFLSAGLALLLIGVRSIRK